MKSLKMTLILVLCIGLVQVSLGQPDTLWTRTFSGIEYIGTAVLQAESGDFVIGGEGWGSLYGNYPILFCLDADGNEKWFKTWINDTTINEHFNSVLPEIYEIEPEKFMMGCDGYCAGMMWYDHLLDSTHVIIYDDSWGWGMTFETVSPVKFQKIQNNEYIIVWNLYSGMWFSTCILKVNQSGDSLWYDQKEWMSSLDVSPTVDGGFVLLKNIDGLEIGKTSGMGDSIWTKKIYCDTTKGYIGKSISQTKEGGYIVLADLFVIDQPDLIINDSYLYRTNELGDTLWTKYLGTYTEEVLNKIKPTPDGGFIIFGSTTETGDGTADMLIIKVDKLGNVQWRKIFSGNGDDYISDVTTTKDGGYVIVGNKGIDIWVVRLASDLTSLSSSGVYEVEDYALSQNYPNPFNPSTTIEYDLPNASDVRIEVYNIAGQKVQTLLNEKMSSGNHQVEFNAQNLSSGVYFYRIEVGDPARRTGEFQDVKKMILLR